MVKNNIYPWAQGINANVLTDEEYVDALSTNGIYENGVKSGIASSSQINKTLRQATVPASGLSQFIVNTLDIDVNDNDSINIFSDRITNSILKLAQINPFNQSFANAIGGYRKYAIVSGDNNNFWVSTKDNNLTIPGNVNSDWVNLFDSAIKWANSEFLRLKSETKQEVKSDVKFSKLLETNNQTVNGNIDIRGIEKSDGKVNISKMIHLWIRDDVSGWMNVEEIIGLVTNIVVGVQGGGTTNYFRLSNMGKLTCNDLQINESINCDTITTNNQTVNGNINMYGIEKSDGKVNISKMYHIWIRDDVSGWVNVEEIIGDRTNIVLGVKGGGTTGYFRLSNLGDFSCNSITAGMINASGNIHAGSADISGKMNANTIETPGDITINSGNRTWDDGGHFNGNALFCKKDDGLFYKLWLYDQLNVGSMVKLSVNDKYEFHFRDNGTIDAKEFNGVSMSAFCADLAEYYIADERYDPGTLVKIGGEKEITRASIGGFFYGVISTAPAYVMNTAIRDERNALPVALAGRVPVLMTGMIDKGDPITISEISGVARKAGDGEKHIGFSMENSHETSIRHVECVIKQN
ncbi:MULTISPECIES: hypothetical protein [unclassified Commensalibacter]|uniref:hypothetical protein n=1 Tax=unclassified Commensalibacter TaxID=2630218 RepID=UPI0018DC806E|nr:MULTISPECIES: hypothetical protein [unclassified Commensalibacter]MBI0016404.1 hypothetical protein [Commensalibacter sp. B14384M2]MBI0049278.1 hypothetical protein [Commensalibacter sp. B14384M3]MBI0178934.1 hypothetical protein [Commensalibacter sp. W8163]